MKKITWIFIAIIIVSIFSCEKDDEGINPIPMDVNFRQEMRDFIIGMSNYSKSINSNFKIIPQNGIELISQTGNADGALSTAYLNAIDGHGQEDLWYGYNNDNEATPANETEYLLSFLDASKNKGNTILVTDYCSTISMMDDSYQQNNAIGYVSFAADQRELNNIPTHPNPVFGENDNNINALSEVKNFLYLINPGNYNSKSDFINAVTTTNYDMLLMDVFFDGDVEFTASEINQLRQKANGGTRLVIAYMSIGEAEDYRYYWQNEWSTNQPSWLDKENPNWPGNYKVKYWETDWQDIIFRNNDSYLKKILDVNFDGVYLDIVSAYEYFE